MSKCIIEPFPSKSAIKQEAGAWIVKIDSAPLTPEQAQELNRWMATSDYHKQYLQKLAKNWDAMAILQELAELFPISTSAVNHSPLSHSPSSWAARIKYQLSQLKTNNRPLFWKGSAFATVALMVMASLLIISQPQTHFATAIGQQASYQLPDGTTLRLNTNSEASIEYSNERRVVRLQRGEANFDVAKNPERPFMVYAGDGMVWAVGTAFNVRYSDNQITPKKYRSIDVIVTEGTIKVYADISDPELVLGTDQLAQAVNSQQPQKEALVDAGSRINYSRDINSIDTATQQQVNKQLAWQQGALIFKGETLQQALQEISRYTTKQLIIIDDDLKAIRVGGHYKTDDIGALLAALSQGFGIKITAVGAERLELSKKVGQSNSQEG